MCVCLAFLLIFKQKITHTDIHTHTHTNTHTHTEATCIVLKYILSSRQNDKVNLDDVKKKKKGTNLEKNTLTGKQDTSKNVRSRVTCVSMYN